MRTVTWCPHKCVNCGVEVLVGVFFDGQFLCQECYPKAGDIVHELRTDLTDSSAQLVLDECEIQKLRVELKELKFGYQQLIDHHRISHEQDDQLRAELNEARKVIEIIDNLHPDFPVITAFLKAHPEEEK
jgi:hypothetical protein